ncbi:hypothetical protein F4806DRAFT_485327 [Annulohypoxylon nitens]|nr:hypothetical protein F4806DRAFT_485327 [Annulohypoxylon nitens]
MDQLLGIISQPFKRHLIVPFRQNEDFVGRESTLRKLLERIPPSAKRNKLQMNVIEGLGGVGKTQVALEVAYQAYKRFPDCSVFWVPVINMASFENAYREIGKALEVDRLEDDDADMKSLVKTALEENAGDWLLVIDNADDPELLFGRAGGPAIRDYLPYSRQGSILLTTRNHDVTVGFDNLEEAEAMRMLEKNLKGSQMRDIENTRRLLALLAYLPLAIKQASAYLEHCLSSDTTQANLLTKRFEDQNRYRDSVNPIATTWLISLNQIERDYPMAARYLKCICFMGEKDIPKSLLPPGDKLEEDGALGVLIGYAFITMREQGDSFDIHRLNEERAEIIAYTFAYLSTILPFPQPENQRLWKRYMPHVETALEVGRECIQCDMKCSLLHFVARGYELGARYERSEKIYREILDLLDSIKNHSHHATMFLGYTEKLAYSLLHQGKYQEAEQLSLGKRDAIPSMNHLATALGGQGNFREAERIHRRALDLSKKMWGPEHGITLASMGNLSDILRIGRKYDEAEKTMWQTIELNRKALGSGHPETLLNTHFLAMILDKRGRHSEAETLARENLELRKSVLGVEHPRTLESMSLLAESLLHQGMKDEAEILFKRTAELKKRVLGPKHPSTLLCMYNLAWTLHNQQGRYEEAERIFRQTMNLRVEVLGPKHLETMLNMDILACVLDKQGKYEEAENILQRLANLEKEIQVKQKGLGTTSTMNNLACVLAKQGKYEEAECTLRQLAHLRQEIQGPEHPRTINTMNHLAYMLSKQGKYEEEQQMHQRTTKIYLGIF